MSRFSEHLQCAFGLSTVLVILSITVTVSYVGYSFEAMVLRTEADRDGLSSNSLMRSTPYRRRVISNHMLSKEVFVKVCSHLRRWSLRCFFAPRLFLVSFSRK